MPATLAAAEYRLQRGDLVSVSHTLDPDYSVTVAIGPDGRIAVPGIKQPVDVQNLTLPALRDRLDQAYRREGVLKEPFFQVSVAGFANLQMFVGGEVSRPGALNLSGGTRSMMQALMAVGGALPTARLNQVLLVRVRPDGRLEAVQVDLTRVLDGQDLTQNLPLHPLDVMFVPKSPIANLDRWVDQNIRLVTPVPFAVIFRLSNGAFVP